MEKIEGVDLEQLVNDVDAELMEEKRRKASSIIRGMMADVAKWKSDRDNAQKEIAKLSDKIAKAQEKLIKIRAGDWSLLTDKQNQNQQKQEAMD